MTTSGDPITIVLADDHAVVRKGIREFLECDPNLHVLAEASDGEQAIARTLQYKPDVVVLDIQMPLKSGIEVTQYIRAQGLNLGILIVSAYNDDPFVRSALQAGANGYMLKTAEPEELVQAVRDVCEGQAVLDKQIPLHALTASMAGTSVSIETPSHRELEVLQLVAQGFTNKAIAVQLGISDRTVQGHLANIFSKLNVQSRTEAVMVGLQNHWVTAP